MKLSILFCLFAFIYLTQAYVYKSTELNDSLKTWKILKSHCYIYTVVNVNDSGQTVSRTTIKVKNEKVISRSYKKTDLFYSPGQVHDSWEEATPCSIGSHGGQYGTDISPAVTLDQIYAYCKNSILNQEQDISNGEDFNSAAFETFNNGVIAYCAFYVGQCDGFCGDIINVDDFRTC